jgi:hypothetical protein
MPNAASSVARNRSSAVDAKKTYPIRLCLDYSDILKPLFATLIPQRMGNAHCSSRKWCTMLWLGPDLTLYVLITGNNMIYGRDIRTTCGFSKRIITPSLNGYLHMFGRVHLYISTDWVALLT